MEELRKIDFKKHTSPRVSKWYLLKIIFYAILLSLMIYLILTQFDKNSSESPEDAIENVQEIDSFTLEEPNSE